MSSTSNKKCRSVCIIGAGAAGLCALRHFINQEEEFSSVICYEQSAQIGGTWNYTDQTGNDENGLPLHTSMYRDLHTNLPMQIMEFPDFPWRQKQSFVHHSKVLQYLVDYAKHFGLLPYIHLEHHLTRLTRTDDDGQWQVTLCQMKQQHSFTRTFDILILCPGRHSLPYYPEIPSLTSNFTGSVIHSHDYRRRESYTGQRVALIGGGPTGFDLAIEVGSVAAEVVFINRSIFQFENLPANVRQLNGEVVHFSADSMSVKLKDDSILKFPVDSVILATGYLFNLSYLDQKSTAIRLTADDTLDGLYRHMVNIKYPSMALLGICQKGVLPFPMYHQQVLYYRKLLLGKIAIPTISEMKKEVEDDLLMRAAVGYRPKDRHCLKVDLLIEYIRLLERDAQLTPLKAVVMKLHADLYPIRCKNICTYKHVDYRILDDETYEEA